MRLEGPVRWPAHRVTRDACSPPVPIWWRQRTQSSKMDMSSPDSLARQVRAVIGKVLASTVLRGATSTEKRLAVMPRESSDYFVQGRPLDKKIPTSSVAIHAIILLILGHPPNPSKTLRKKTWRCCGMTLSERGGGRARRRLRGTGNPGEPALLYASFFLVLTSLESCRVSINLGRLRHVVLL